MSEPNQNRTRKIVIRSGTSNDLTVCIPIYYEAFSRIDAQHKFPAEIPNEEWGKNILDYLFSSGLHFMVAEMDGLIVGGNFIDERSVIAGVGPIFVSPDVQHLGIGRGLMQAVINRPRDWKLDGIRLLQASFNLQSLSLYAKLGFIVREPIAVMAGVPLRGRTAPGCTVRCAETADLAVANALYYKMHGFDRSLDLQAAIGRSDALVVEREGKLTGYASGFGYFAHAVGESNLDIQALLCAATRIDGIGIFIPSRNDELFRWCLESGMRVVLPYTLMTMGSYTSPKGAYIPSVLF